MCLDYFCIEICTSFTAVTDYHNEQIWQVHLFVNRLFVLKLTLSLKLLRGSYVHIFDFLRLNKWGNIMVFEGYFVAKYKKFPGGIGSFVRLANVSMFFTSVHTHVWFYQIYLHERLLYNQMYTYFDSFFSEYKFGSRKGFSAQYCLTVILKNWKKAEIGYFTVFIGFKYWFFV